ncbi:MAG: Rieske 2Fe-2S domain-containing protein, partial [Myxococcota bacterium]
MFAMSESKLGPGITMYENETFSHESTSGYQTAVALKDGWYVLCNSEELGSQPIRRFLHGEPLVLFRDSHGQPGVLLDRCPHRNVPLSRGRIRGGDL